MLAWVLVVTTLFVSDVAGNTGSLDVEEVEEVEEKRGYDPRYLTQGHCDENWFYFPPSNTCNRFYRDKRTWKDAEEFCRQLPHYGNLASVTSSTHNTFISDVIRAADASRPSAWIGLSDIWKEGTFLWTDGTFYTYRGWANHQPDNYQGKEDCVHILSGFASWNDLPCGSKVGFVCAYRLQ